MRRPKSVNIKATVEWVKKRSNRYSKKWWLDEVKQNRDELRILNWKNRAQDGKGWKAVIVIAKTLEENVWCQKEEKLIILNKLMWLKQIFRLKIGNLSSRFFTLINSLSKQFLLNERAQLQTIEICHSAFDNARSATYVLTSYYPLLRCYLDADTEFQVKN